MSFFNMFKKPARVPVRKRLTVENVRLLLEHALRGATQPNYKAFWSKAEMATVTDADIETASRAAFAPWSRHRWECEDQARSLIEHAQRRAANEGMTWAVGMLFADPPEMFPDRTRHVYVWAVVGSSIVFYDPTAREWVERPDNIYFSLL